MAQLLDLGDAHDPLGPTAAAAPAGGKPRLRVPQRDQVEMHCASLDQLLPPEHEARLVWEAVGGLDLGPWLGDVKAVAGRPGRDATDPRLLLALWVYATLQGVGSARELADLCTQHTAYRWLCGGVTLNHHTLADFRSRGGDHWDAALTHLVAGLMAEGLVELQRVAQDGVRVRASAGRSSFRRRATLERCLAAAEEQVQALKRLADADPGELGRRQQAARERAAAARRGRVQEALKHVAALQGQREERAQTTGEPAREARASTTDPEARTMKFADGGYQPGYNVQFCTDVGSRIIVGVDVTNAGNDGEELPPMLDQLHERCGRDPAEALVDGGFATKGAITDAAVHHGCAVYAPLKDEDKQKAAGKDPYAKKKGDTPAVAAWRARMGGAEAQRVYRLRAQTAEWVNAQCRNRGLRQLPVRGTAKARIVALLYALAHNLMEAVKLRATAALRAAVPQAV